MRCLFLLLQVYTVGVVIFVGAEHQQRIIFGDILILQHALRKFIQTADRNITDTFGQDLILAGLRVFCPSGFQSFPLSFSQTVFIPGHPSCESSQSPKTCVSQYRFPSVLHASSILQARSAIIYSERERVLK